MNIIKKPEEKDYPGIIKTLEKGNLVVYPTDTIYGIAANINSERAIKKVFNIKKRSYNKAISASFHDYGQIREYAKTDARTDKIIEALLPGPYTLLLEKKSKTSPLLTGGSEKIGVRIPDHPVSSMLTKKFPVTSTSANITGKTTPNNINGIINELKDEITTYIDDGVLKNNKASTIIDLTQEKPVLIRQGLGDTEKIEKIL